MGNSKPGSQQQKDLEDYKKITEMREANMSNKDIAEALGMTERNVYNKVNKVTNLFSDKLTEGGFSPHTWSNGWLKTEEASIHIRNALAPDWEKITEDMVEKLKKHSKKTPKIKYAKVDEPHLLKIDHADHHFGKYAAATETGSEYNLKIAETRFVEGLHGIIEKSKGFNIDQVLLVIGNDVLHIDNVFRKTTSGTPQDTDGQWHEAFDKALECYVMALETLSQIAPVHVVYNPSNHDFMSGYMLAQATKAWFHKDKNITFDVDMRHRKYYQYGKSLIVTTHGDGAKDTDMPIIIAQESSQMWADTVYRYCYQHHVHHKIAKDYIGLTIEYLRSAAGTDSWHDRKGYISKPAVDGFIHSKEWGQVARLTHYF